MKKVLTTRRGEGEMEEDVSSLSDDDDDDGVGFGNHKDTNPGGAGKRKVLHPEGR